MEKNINFICLYELEIITQEQKNMHITRNIMTFILKKWKWYHKILNMRPIFPFQTRYILNDLNPVWDEIFNEDVCHQVLGKLFD